MNVVIYQSLIIHIFILFYGVSTREVHMTNISEILGADGIRLKCSYKKNPDDVVSGIKFLAINDSTDKFVDVAESTIFNHKPPQIFPFGVSLFGSANISNITESSTEVVLTFNGLQCKHERRYKCRMSVYDHAPLVSEPMQIFVLVPPSKPEKIALITTLIDVSTSTESAIIITSTSTYNETENSIISRAPKNNNYSTSFLSNFSSSIVDNNITFTTISYNQSIEYNSTEPTNESPSIMEGDNITVSCSGNVGKPAEIFSFQKFLKDQLQPMNYNATTTTFEGIPENCSYYRKSYLTLQVTAEDNQAVIRCLVKSPLGERDMYIDTEELEVKYNVLSPTVTKYPDKKEYIVGVDTSITLTCTSDGNPKPIYRWYKCNQDDYIGTEENFTITNINTTNSDLYICNVSNTINDHIYTEAAKIEVNIMNEADKSTTRSTSIGISSGADDTTGNSTGNIGPVIGGVLGVVGVFLLVILSYFVYIRRKRTSKIPTDKNESEGSVDSKSKPIAESRTGNYDIIALNEDANKTQTVNNGLEVDDIKEHNKEYLKKQKEEEQNKNESNTPPQPAVYAQVNEATKSRNKQKTETPDSTDKQEEDTYAETQEGIYDKAGDPRHKENENVEHFDSSNNSSNGDTELSIHKSQMGSYANQAFEKDENRKVATVSPTIRSSSGSQNDEQTILNRNSQSKTGYENIISADPTGISEENSSHRTAL